MLFEWFKSTSKPSVLVNILDSALGFYDLLMFYETEIHIVEMGGIAEINLSLFYFHLCFS